MNESEYRKMVKGAFNEASAGYDNPAMRFFDLSAEHLVSGLPLSGGEHVLDVAAGTGKIALRAARRVPSGKVMALDMSEGMLERAREKAARDGLGNVLFKLADVAEASLPEEHFDGFTCGFGVHFWTDMEGALKKILRWVKPGGFMAATSFLDGSFRPLSDLLLERFKSYGVQLPKTYSWEKLDHPDKAAAVFGGAGIKGVRTEVRQMGYHLKSAEEWWTLVLYSGFRGFLNQLSPEQAARYKEEHLKEIAAQAGPEGIFLDVRVIFAQGRK